MVNVVTWGAVGSGGDGVDSGGDDSGDSCGDDGNGEGG